MGKTQFKFLNYIGLITVVLILHTNQLFGQKYKNDFSKYEKKRHARKSTKYCLLHTTEASNMLSLKAVKRQGTCNYLVTTDGVIHLIISHNKLAKHAGISMWNGHSNLSNCSIGIEVAGFHNKKPTAKQLNALEYLIERIKDTYPSLSDDKFITHSMAAYQPAGKYWRFKERGRKRCGMLFATPAIRKKIGLKNVFCNDPDVDAGRIHNEADPFLANILYCGSKKTCVNPQVKKINDMGNDDDEESFVGFKKIGKLGVKKVVGDEYNSETTIYFFPDGVIRTGAELGRRALSVSPETKVIVGYTYGGQIGHGRTAYSVVGDSWDEASTYYRFPDGKILSGVDIDEDELVQGTIVLFRQ